MSYDPDLGLLTYVTCCRPWLVFALWPVGRCGYCGQVPLRQWGAAATAARFPSVTDL